MTWGAIVVGVGSAVYGGIEGNQAKQKAKGAANAAAQNAENAKVDIGALNNQVNQIATNNAVQSQQLEDQLNPGINNLRSSSTAALLNDLGTSPQQQSIINGLNTDLNSPQSLPALQRSALLNSAISKAQGNLALGGNLDVDTQNAVTRAALAKAGTIQGGTGLGLGRDVTARDLGLTSMNVAEQRLNDASNLGQVDQGINSTQQQLQNQLNQTNQTNRLNISSLLNSLGQQQFQNQLNIGQFTQGIQGPAVGLDPGSAANIAIGNANLQAGAGQQAAAIQAQGQTQANQIYGQAAGTAIGALGKYFNSPSVSTAPTVYGYSDPGGNGNGISNYKNTTSPGGGNSYGYSY
jgi:hypothetical protein